MYPYAKGSLMPRKQLAGMQGQMQGMDPSQMGQPMNPAQMQGQMDPSQMQGQGQMDPRMAAQMQAQMRQQQQMQEQQANMQETQDANQSAFPQGQQHQVFIQEALKQGYSPDVVMNFLAQQLGQKR